MSSAWDRMLKRFHDMQDIEAALGVLWWDLQVMMPPGGAGPRSRSIATLESLAHEMLTDAELGDLIDELSADEALSPDQRASLRVLRRERDKAIKVPPDLVRALSEASSSTYQTWVECRPNDDWEGFEPHLRKMFELKKQEADALGWEESRYDAMLDNFEPAAKSSEVEAMFNDLVDGLGPLVDAVLGAAGEPPEFVHGEYDPGRQEAFARWLAEHTGFDMDSGRLDKSPHPITFGLAPTDVRQTIRTDPSNTLSAVYAAMHETGHALYEQGIPEDLYSLPVGRAASFGIHESQSRLWENQVGRSKAFVSFLLPKLKEYFPQELGMTTPDEFYRGVNHVKASLIRVEADELTYNLHVIVRFELEKAIFNDELDVTDLPDAWDAAMDKHLGLRPETNADGVMQDVHWPQGFMGYFPTYTIGTLYSAAFFEKASDELPDLEDDLRRGETRRLLEWLRAKVHSEGYRKEPQDLASDVYGEPPGAQPFLRYVRAKYTELYDVSV